MAESKKETGGEGTVIEGVCNSISPRTPDYCPFSVEIEPSNSQGLEHLRLSTVNKTWTLAMKTTVPFSLSQKGSILSHDSEYELSTAAEEEFPLNKMDHALVDLDVQQALSNEQHAPHGLVPVSSDSESSSRDESLDAVDDQEEDEGNANECSMSLHRSPDSSEAPCVLSARLSRTPTRKDKYSNDQCNDTPGAVPLNPLNHLQVLNPGVPQGHRTQQRHHLKTPQRNHRSLQNQPQAQPANGNSTTITTTNSSGVATASAADCIYECFAIEDFTQFFCPSTPKSGTLDTTTTTGACPSLPTSASAAPSGMGCLPPYNYDFDNPVPSSKVAFPSIQSFWLSHPSLPRSRGESAFDANLPRNRSYGPRKKRVRKLLDVWHGPVNRNYAIQRSLDDASLDCRRQSRRKRAYASKWCYDSDPENEVIGRRQRRAALLLTDNCQSSAQALQHQSLNAEDSHPLEDKLQPRYRKFRPSPFTHLDTDEESCTESDVEETSYESAGCDSDSQSDPPPPPPRTPRNSDPKISFLFQGDTMDESEVDGDIDDGVHTNSNCKTKEVDEDSKIVAFDFGKTSKKLCSVPSGHRRNTSSTSLSTTGHSRFHTIRRSAEDAQEECSSESSTESLFLAGSAGTRSNPKLSEVREHNLLPQYFKSHPTHWTEFHLLFSRNVDEDSVKSHVHELSNVKFPLVWHPAADSGSYNRTTKAASSTGKSSGSTIPSTTISCPTAKKIASLSSNGDDTGNGKCGGKNNTKFPIAVDGAFEVGSHLEHMVVQPKFTWTPLAQPHLEEEEDAHDPTYCKNSRELFLSESAPPQVELLSIIRVNKACAYNHWDRNRYPYARLDRTCVVSTNDKNHSTIVLEARCPQERDWLVFSLKLIVARLASIIITRDEDMLHEFFSPYSALMQLEDEDEAQQGDEGVRSTQLEHQEGCSDSVIPRKADATQCAVSPMGGEPCSGNAVSVIDDGSGSYVYTHPHEQIVGGEESGSVLLEDSDGIITFDDDDDAISNESDENDDGFFQDRDDQDQEDSVRARNSGAYAILRRSLTATGALVDHEENHHEDEMVRTLSY
ncbi:unnamed protein product [Pseudo-nitzschia multistriata]|uniref:Uncharacterized protein n=1 Tax=Pseudo-nitzschia multistriata TaxID=183589 RepID=A0A448ZLB3_9STRA|nr:unnamed protein product [Pseudo-nitzschia multistriata]